MKTEQLQVMVKNLRAECGHSLTVTTGNNQEETLKYLLGRTQEELWTAFIWPELKYRAGTVLSSGQYLYPFVAAMPYDCIREAWTSAAGTATTPNWTPITYGITDENLILADNSNSQRADPVQYWDIDSPTQYRLWPTPNTAAYLRFIGQKALGVFAANTDVSTLDSTVIVLFAAADLLARAKAEDADIKMQKAQRHLTKLLGNKVNARNKVSTLGGGSPNRRGANGSLTFGRGF